MKVKLFEASRAEQKIEETGTLASRQIQAVLSSNLIPNRETGLGIDLEKTTAFPLASTVQAELILEPETQGQVPT